MIASQRSRPTTSRHIQNLPRSRYSHPWAPKKTAVVAESTGPWIAEVFARHAPDDDHHQRSEQGEREGRLAPRLAAGDQRGEEDAGRQVGRGDEEERQLDVPGPGQVVGEDPRQVEAEEAGRLHPVVHREDADDVLEHEEGRDDEEVPGRGLCAGVRGASAGLAERSRASASCQPRVLRLPAESASTMPMPPSRAMSDSAAPDDGRPGHGVDERFRGPVVGVRSRRGRLELWPSRRSRR